MKSLYAIKNIAAYAVKMPYYPIRLVGKMTQLEQYVDLAEMEEHYLCRPAWHLSLLDMDVTIAEAMNAARVFLKTIDTDKKMPAFTVIMR